MASTPILKAPSSHNYRKVDSMNNVIAAACSCGEVEFKSTKNPVIQLCCHCSDCREVTKNDYTTLAFFNRSSVNVSGKLSVQEFTSESGSLTVRELCSNCNSVMFDSSEGFPTLIGVATQQMSAPFEVKPSHHVWVKSKLPHVSIPQGVKQFEKGIS